MRKPSARSQDQTTEREEVLSILADNIRAVDDRIDAREFKDADDEQLQIRWVRTLGYLSGQYRKLMKDTDIDEMEDELELLQKATDVTEDDR